MRLLDRSLDRYVGLGLGFAVVGGPLALFSWYVLLNTPLTALGLGLVVLGATLVLVPGSPVPREAVRGMVEGACVNVEALLEEFDARGRAVYLPPRDGRVYVWVPLKADAKVDESALVRAPSRVLSEVGGVAGLMVFPPGSEVVRLSGLGGEAGLEEALGFVLVDYLEGVESVKSVRVGDRVVVEVVGPRMVTGFPRFASSLGSLPVSVAGCVLASSLGRPVFYLGEDGSGRRVNASFRVGGSSG